MALWLAMASLPLGAAGTNAAPASGDDFGQYLADHQAELAPVFTKNADDFFRLGVPLVIAMTGWVVVITMLVGWVIDVLMSNGFAFFFAPASMGWKRAVVYATGRLFLSFVYTCLLVLAVVFSLKLTHPGTIIGIAVILLLIVAFAAQVVWVLYLYRISFALSAAFYIVIIVAHTLVGALIAKPVIGMQASTAVADFVNRVITPPLQAEAVSTKRELAVAASARDATNAKVVALQNQIDQAQTEEKQLSQEIEEKKDSDIFVFSQIVQVHARGDLKSARDQLTAFLAKFPSSSLEGMAQGQLNQVNNQIAAADAQQKQEAVDTVRAAAEAKADLLARAQKGEVTLSEMRRVLIGKTRAQVSDLLGLPSDTASDSWAYRQQMILNPLTNQRYGLVVNFTEGTVQGVDYNRSEVPP
ncbi:MAG: DUF4407 domain-containing protein [Methylacidiphilales bacterium]|nr:DUF4407 domain-containing protein [Candidatus Methylacidiphilales bacterium]